MAHRQEDKARENDYAGEAFQADAAMNPAVRPMDDDSVTDNKVKPSEQTDYRSVDEGLTSVGVTSQNSDTAVLGNTDTPGVRAGSDVADPGVKVAGRQVKGPDAEEIVEGDSDPISGDNIDDKAGGGVLNDPYNRKI